jgi:hypothetical protein
MMELSLYPYNEAFLYATPWSFYHKLEGCYLAEGEDLDDYLPYGDVLTFLKKKRDLPLWHLILQDAVKEILTCLLSSGFPEGEDLQGRLHRFRSLLMTVPDHPSSKGLLQEIDCREARPLDVAARSVALWHQMDVGLRSRNRQETVETLSPVDTCMSVYPSRIRKALLELQGKLKKCATYLEGAYLHGSLATLDYVPNASDLDMIYILNEKSCRRADSILALRDLLQETTPCFFSIDSLQHHGPYILTPRIRANYLESYLPLAVWKTSRPLIGPRKQIFTICRSPYHDQLWFRRSVQYYRRCLLEGKSIESAYEAKLLVSMASLLPAVAYTHVSGTYSSKGKAFEWVKASFPDEPIRDWIANLTRIRQENLFRTNSWELGRQTEAGQLTPACGLLDEALKEEPYLGLTRLCDRVLGMDIQARQNGVFRRYSNFPRTADVRLYDRVVEKLTHALRSIPAVTRVLVSGTLSHPGISDLDLVIVTEDTLSWQNARKIERLYDILDKQEKALAMHPPMAVVPERLLPDAPWLFPLFVTHAPYGEMPRFPAVSGSEREFLSLVLLTDLGMAMNGRLFQEMIRRREMDVRLLLNQLKGLKYAVRLLDEAGGEVESFSPFIKDVGILRDGWMDRPCAENLAVFLNRGLENVNALNREVERLWQRLPVKMPDSSLAGLPC